jgi:hypothetical protein
MKTRLIIPVMLLTLSMSQIVASQSSPNYIAIRISIVKPTYEIGEAIQVEIQVKDDSDQPLIVPNSVSEAENSAGHVAFSLTDTAGHHQPSQMSLIGDTFAPFPSEPNLQLLLAQWLVLFPHHSVSSRMRLDAAKFPFLNNPGRYSLSAIYSSAGLSYPPNYRRLGLTDQDVASFQFREWSGKVRSNSVWLTVVRAKTSAGRP